MDPELISYLDQRFREMSLQNEGLRQEVKDLRGEMSHRFEQLEARMERVESRVERVETRIDQIENRIVKLDDRVHLTQIALEGLRSDVRLVAEGMMSNEEKIVTLREEVTRKLDDMGITIRQSYQDVSSRVRRIESSLIRESRDPIELIREKFGKQPGNS